MAESHQKRPREEPETPQSTDSKRQYSLQQSSDDSSLLGPTDQLELSAATEELSAFDFDILPTAEEEEEDKEQVHRHTTTAECSSSTDEDDGGVSSVIRHLLEASDDELGIPSNVGGGGEEENSLPIDFGKEGLWEFEDLVAAYYSYVMLQSELFM